MNIKKDFAVIFKDEDWVKKTLIGGLFLGLPPLSIFSFGFLARFIYERLETGKKELPSWNNWGALFLKGLEWGLIIVFYFAIPVLILSLLPKSVIVFLVNPKFVISSLNVKGYLLLFLSFLLGFGVMFFLPMALILFSDSGSFIDSFLFQNIFKHIKSKLSYYIIAYLLTILLFAVDSLIHFFSNMYVVQFGLIPSYFLFVWLGFVISLLSASLFVESF